MYVDPGDLNKKIQIVRKLNDKVIYVKGKPVMEEEIVRSCWAKVTSTSGTELIKAGWELADAKKRFLVRWTPTQITEAMTVRYAGDDHEIKRVNTYSDDKRYMEIWTDEKKAVT